MTPLSAEAVRRRIERLHIRVRQQMFDVARERFILYVPPREPTGGYGLLVFVPPWPQAAIPPGWSPILDRYGIIFVSAERSGNDENVLERRIPLALAALENVGKAHRIDPSRTFVGGFSGGARVAMRIALAYPDKFAGALLDAGSDPIGERGTPLPSTARLLQFQTRTKLAYATGAADEGGLSLDSASLASMQHWCVANVSVRNEPRVGHDVADGYVFGWAVNVLTADPKRETAALSECRARRSAEAQAALDRAAADIEQGRQAEAKEEIVEADRKYGGLAAPRSIELADRCSCGILDAAEGAASPGRRDESSAANAVPGVSASWLRQPVNREARPRI